MNSLNALMKVYQFSHISLGSEAHEFIHGRKNRVQTKGLKTFETHFLLEL